MVLKRENSYADLIPRVRTPLLASAREPAEERYISGARARNDFRRKCTAINGDWAEWAKIGDANADFFRP